MEQHRPLTAIGDRAVRRFDAGIQLTTEDTTALPERAVIGVETDFRHRDALVAAADILGARDAHTRGQRGGDARHARDAADLAGGRARDRDVVLDVADVLDATVENAVDAHGGRARHGIGGRRCSRCRGGRGRRGRLRVAIGHQLFDELALRREFLLERIDLGIGKRRQRRGRHQAADRRGQHALARTSGFVFVVHVFSSVLTTNRSCDRPQQSQPQCRNKTSPRRAGKCLRGRWP